MNEHDKDRNVQSLALALRVECPVLSPETSEHVARELIESTGGWQRWDDSRPEKGTVIVGKDVIGFVHDATHLIGDKTGQWVEMWKRVVV